MVRSKLQAIAISLPKLIYPPRLVSNVQQRFFIESIYKKQISIIYNEHTIKVDKHKNKNNTCTNSLKETLQKHI